VKPALCSFVLFVAACETPGPPGDRVGEFRISARLDSNGCGPSAVQATQSAEFDVDLRREGEAGWWIPDGQAPVPGEVDESGAFRFEIRGQTAVREEDPTQGLAACTLDHVDEVRGFVSGGEDAGPAASLAGEESLSFAASAGSDCSDQLGLGTGQFLALPCQVRYVLEGNALPQGPGS
jgi:hypothetical protein